MTNEWELKIKSGRSTIESHSEFVLGFLFFSSDSAFASQTFRKQRRFRSADCFVSFWISTSLNGWRRGRTRMENERCFLGITDQMGGVSGGIRRKEDRNSAAPDRSGTVAAATIADRRSAGCEPFIRRAPLSEIIPDNVCRISHDPGTGWGRAGACGRVYWRVHEGGGRDAAAGWGAAGQQGSVLVLVVRVRVGSARVVDPGVDHGFPASGDSHLGRSHLWVSLVSRQRQFGISYFLALQWKKWEQIRKLITLNTINLIAR